MVKFSLEDVLLIFIPISAFLYLGAFPPLYIFASSVLALIALSAKLGEATEEIAKHVGENVGAMLNATFGNATELIIALIAIKEGLFEVVKASITGSIIGNMLFVLGASLLLGGIKYKQMKFNSHAAGMNASMLLIAVFALMIPSIFFNVGGMIGANGITTPIHKENLEALSIGISVLVILVYLLSLVFSFKTHSYLFRTKEEAGVEKKWSKEVSVAVLVIATVLIAGMAEIFISSIEPIIHEFNLPEIFVGAIIIAIVGNAAEHMTAVTFALKNKIDMSISITVGSSIQIAMFIAPLLVLVSAWIGKPMDLAFNIFEVLAVFGSVLVVNELTSDGETNWFEGAQLLVVYLILAVMFFLL